jgi:hypothetical protein
MPQKPKSEPDDPEQLKRFKEMDREVGAGEHPERFDRVLERVARSSRSRTEKATDAQRQVGNLQHRGKA